MTKKIVSLILIVMIMASTNAYALPNYTLPQTTLKKLEGMPDVNESLRSVYDSALKKLESKGFGKNNYPNGMGELIAPTGFGKSANELYKSKFGSSFSSSPGTITSTNPSKPGTTVTSPGVDLNAVYNRFKSALDTGSANELKSGWEQASATHKLPTAEELGDYKKIDSKSLMEDMVKSFDKDAWKEINSRDAKDLGKTIPETIEDTADSTKRVINGKLIDVQSYIKKHGK